MVKMQLISLEKNKQEDGKNAILGSQLMLFLFASYPEIHSLLQKRLFV